MTQTTLLEGWLSSSNPESIPLLEFYIEARKLPTIFEAPVRHVSCHRQGVHEYVLVHCSVTLPNAPERPIMAYFRLERNPAQKSVRILSGKPSQAADTVLINRKLETLHQEHSSMLRGHLLFNREDNAPKTLMLRHILEMYECLSRASCKYTIIGTNCRWLCFGILECLRGCKPCFGGQWFKGSRKDTIPKQDNQAAIQAKDVYLKEKHPDCCSLRGGIMSKLVEEATAIGTALTNIVEMASQVQEPAQTSNPSSPEAMCSTAGLATPVAHSTPLPGANVSPTASNPPQHPVPSGMPAVMNHPNGFYNEAAMHVQHPGHLRPPHPMTGPTTPLRQQPQLHTVNPHPAPGYAAPPQHAPGRMPVFVREPYPAHNDTATRLPHPAHPSYPHHLAQMDRQSMSHLSQQRAWVPPPSQTSFDPHISSQGFTDEPTSYTQHPGVAHGGYQPCTRAWGSCSCLECVSQMPRPGTTPGYDYPPQAPNYHYPRTDPPPPPPRAAGGFQHHTAYTRQRTAQAGISALHGIPEGHVPEMAREYNPNRQAYPTSVYGQPPMGYSNYDHRGAAPIPRPQNTIRRPHPESTYSNGFPAQHYQNSVSSTSSSSTVRGGVQPQHSQPRWFPQDSTTEAPTRVDSPTQMSQRTMDDIEFSRTSEYTHGPPMNMPDPDNYYPQGSHSDLV
ncbi:hypothetical protein FRC08_015170 [Ceratobasidium sp. 394]|nr:hypothetical protein FRC08_015170 [Ceratobasidium sp. 394]